MATASNNRRRGLAAERRLASLVDGAIFHGTAGDVDAYGHRVEVKSSVGFRGYGRLKAHIEQAIRNSEASGKPWALALTGGKTFNNGDFYVLVPADAWLASRQALEGSRLFGEKYAAIRELLRRMQQELGVD